MRYCYTVKLPTCLNIYFLTRLSYSIWFIIKKCQHCKNHSSKVSKIMLVWSTIITTYFCQKIFHLMSKSGRYKEIDIKINWIIKKSIIFPRQKLCFVDYVLFDIVVYNVPFLNSTFRIELNKAQCPTRYLFLAVT
jgi:hypothetical protein